MVEGVHTEVTRTSLWLLRWCWHSLPPRPSPHLIPQITSIHFILISSLHAWTFYEERLELTLLLLSYNLRHSLFWFTVSLSVLHVVYLSRVTGSPKYKQPIRILSDTINQSTSNFLVRFSFRNTGPSLCCSLGRHATILPRGPLRDNPKNVCEADYTGSRWL